MQILYKPIILRGYKIKQEKLKDGTSRNVVLPLKVLCTCGRVIKIYAQDTECRCGKTYNAYGRLK